MKKKILIFLIVILIIIMPQSKSIPAGINKIYLQLLEDEIAVIFINDKLDNYLLILTEDEPTLLVLNYNNGTILEQALKKFNFNEITVLTLSNMSLNFNYKQKITLTNHKYELNDVIYQNEQQIINIEYEDYNFCVYLGYNNEQLSNCNYIYYYQNNNISLNNLNRYTYAVFYRSLYPLSTYFLEEAYERWVDTYMIRDEEFLIVKIKNNNYDVFSIPNNE
ncbi:MAG: hypothetical protein PHY26_02200 [Bacilli bacterium]|jgi:mRNA-degrading endonuclease HigB of HigAB toxin-antitoxin module|nr:hypothetical protein [Bacilli bacterium]